MDGLPRARVACLAALARRDGAGPTDVQWYAEQLLADAWPDAYPQRGLCGRLYKTSIALRSAVCIVVAAALVHAAHSGEQTRASGTSFERAAGTFTIGAVLTLLPTLYASARWATQRCRCRCCGGAGAPDDGLAAFRLPPSLSVADIGLYIDGLQAMREMGAERFAPAGLAPCVSGAASAIVDGCAAMHLDDGARVCDKEK